MWDDYVKNVFALIFGSDRFNPMVEVLKFNPATEIPNAWTGVQAVYNNLMVPIALGLMVIWFLVKFMEKSTMEQITLEQVFMLFVKLLAAKFLIDNGLEIFTKLWSLGISLIDETINSISDKKSASIYIFNADGTPSPELQELWKTFTGKDWSEELGFLDSIVINFQLMLPSLATFILIGCVYFIGYTRLMEMLVRICGAPIALSDFMTEGLRGAGWRYLKNFLAVCLQGMLIIVIIRLHNQVLYDVMTNPSGEWYTIMLMQLGVSFSAVALMFKSLSLCKELVGTA